jgi:hypothetical protein|tara:strand:+ start:428 stop:565 length:138 start_codon:yes stop_codon:yes gene_type:complete
MVNTPIVAQDRKMILLIDILNDAADNPVAIVNHIRPNAATGIPMN